MNNIKENDFPTKHYNQMNRREKRQYRKRLHYNNLWDGAAVIEYAIKTGKLTV